MTKYISIVKDNLNLPEINKKVVVNRRKIIFKNPIKMYKQDNIETKKENSQSCLVHTKIPVICKTKVLVSIVSCKQLNQTYRDPATWENPN